MPFAASRSAPLPQELVDDIIGFLHDDQSALRSCSLVGRRWLPASSHHLLACLRWPPCGHQWGLSSEHAQCKCHLLPSNGTLQSLHEICQRSPRICEKVRSLRITMEWISRTAWKSWPDVASTTTTPHELAALLDLLPHLDSLEIFGLQFADAAPRVTPQTQRGPMKHVKLISSRSFRASHTPGHLQHIVDLLCQFSHISELSVGSDSVSPLCPPSTSRRIRTDTLDVVCQSFTMQRGPTMLHALTQNTDLSAVHTLKLSEPGSVAPGQPPCAIFAAALRGCKHLQSLTCTGNASYRALAHPAPCPPLRKLRVQLGTSSRPTPLRDLWADVARLARCALASTVSALGVRIDYSHHARMAGIVEVDEDVRADVRSVAWAPVQDALAALPALRVLEVAVDVRLWAPTWTAGAEEGAVREARRRGLAALRVYVESAVLAGLPLAPGRTLRLAVSMDPVL